MKFTLSWLKDHLETDHSLSEILETLTSIGLEVESVTNPGDQLRGFQIAKILEAKPHPDADRLQVCTVECGQASPLQIVCGAPNARAGIKVVLGLPGSYVPALDVTLKATKIRGVESFGMLCSAKELGLGAEHDGILEVEEKAAVGAEFVEHHGLDDPVIDISVTPNRPDCLGVRGVARDLVAAGLGTLKPLSIPKTEGTFKPDLTLKLEAPAKKGCPHYMGRLFKGVKNRPSPDWLKNKLNAVGMRSISALVDITNYVSVDLCRPLHVFDAQKLKGPVTVRLSQKGEPFLALDENPYTLSEGHVVIADDTHVAALGGVIGGLDSGCTLETQDVLLESAYFDSIFVSTAGRALNLHTDARHRFERGIDPLSTQMGIERATDLILKICGGSASDVIELGEDHHIPAHIPFNGADVLQRTGMDVDEKRQKEILESLGFECGKSGTVSPPSWRPDVSEMVDVVEEVARIHGYEHLPEPLLPRDSAKTLFPERSAETLARHTLAHRQFMEVVTWSMVSEQEFKLFGGKGTSGKIANPITVDLMYMRPSILPHLLKAIQKNTDHGLRPLSFFEVGPVYKGIEAEDQSLMVTGAKVGLKQHMHWSKKQKIEDVFDVKADLMALLGAFNIDAATTQTSTDQLPAWYHPGRSAWVQRGPKNKLGIFGEIHPKILKAFGIKDRVFAFEVNMSALMPLRVVPKKALDISDFPKVERDFSFLFPEEVAAQDIVKALRKVDASVVLADIFDVYQGEDVPKGKKSLSVRVCFEPKEKTFTDQEIKALYDRVVQTVEGQLKGKLKL